MIRASTPQIGPNGQCNPAEKGASQRCPTETGADFWRPSLSCGAGNSRLPALSGRNVSCLGEWESGTGKGAKVLTRWATFSLAPVSWTNCVTAARCAVDKGGILSSRLVLSSWMDGIPSPGRQSSSPNGSSLDRRVNSGSGLVPGSRERCVAQMLCVLGCGLVFREGPMDPARCRMRLRRGCGERGLDSVRSVR
jgi:hypothetical protein